MKALLVALGRMGQRYQQVLQNQFGEQLTLITVDPNPAIPTSATHFRDISDVPTDMTFDLAVDARPNMDRLAMFEAFCQRRIPHIIIEKPHAASMAESHAMLELLGKQTYQPKVMMPFYERYGDHYRPETLKQLDSGELKSIVISSGAIGLGCNGIHMIDLANWLFHAEPQEVFSRLTPQSIPSPRGEQFKDDGGTLWVQYPDQREFILHMRSDSSVGIQITLVYEHGKIQICEQIHPTMEWYQQPKDTWQDPFYRTHRELALTPPCTFEKDLINVMMPRALNDLLNAGPYPNLEDGHRALRVIGLGVASHTQRKPMAWSDKASVEDVTFQFT